MTPGLDSCVAVINKEELWVESAFCWPDWHNCQSWAFFEGGRSAGKMAPVALWEAECDEQPKQAIRHLHSRHTFGRQFFSETNFGELSYLTWLIFSLSFSDEPIDWINITTKSITVRSVFHVLLFHYCRLVIVHYLHRLPFINH